MDPKSFGFPVARRAPAVTAAAMRQSAWVMVTPAAAAFRRQAPASQPSSAPTGMTNRPENSASAGSCSFPRRPRAISSTLMPVVASVRPPSRTDHGGALALVKSGDHGFSYEPAPPPPAGQGIHIGDELVIHVYVHSDVLKLSPHPMALAHILAPSDGACVLLQEVATVRLDQSGVVAGDSTSESLLRAAARRASGAGCAGQTLLDQAYDGAMRTTKMRTSAGSTSHGRA